MNLLVRKQGWMKCWKVTWNNNRPYSPEELFALEQTRGFSHTPEEIGTIVQKAKDFSFPYHEPTQAGSVDVLPSDEEMTVDELFNGPSSMETQPD